MAISIAWLVKRIISTSSMRVSLGVTTYQETVVFNICHFSINFSGIVRDAFLGDSMRALSTICAALIVNAWSNRG